MDRLTAAKQLRLALEMFAQTLTDEQALEVAAVYSQWEPDKSYKAGKILMYSDQLYRVAQAHTSQADWIPGQGTDSLYTAISFTAQGYEEWKQPTGAHNAYAMGTIVSYNGKLYKSLINGNAYSPDEYPAGWEEVTG